MVTPNMSTRIAVALSKEELYVIMRLLHIDAIPQFALDWLQTRPGEVNQLDETTVRALDAATTALVARGYVRVAAEATTDGKSSNQVNMPASVIALVAACAKSQITVVVNGLCAGRSIQASFHWTETFGVAHTVQPYGVHLFEAIQTKESLCEAVLTSMGISRQGEGIAVQVGDVLLSTFEAARQFSLNNNVNSAIVELEKAGCSSALALSLSQAIADSAACFTSVIMLRIVPDATERGTYFAALATQQDCFSMVSKEMLPATIRVQRGPADDVRQLVWARFA